MPVDLPDACGVDVRMEDVADSHPRKEDILAPDEVEPPPMVVKQVIEIEEGLAGRGSIVKNPPSPPDLGALGSSPVIVDPAAQKEVKVNEKEKKEEKKNKKKKRSPKKVPKVSPKKGAEKPKKTATPKAKSRRAKRGNRDPVRRDLSRDFDDAVLSPKAVSPKAQATPRQKRLAGRGDGDDKKEMAAKKRRENADAAMEELMTIQLPGLDLPDMPYHKLSSV